MSAILEATIQVLLDVGKERLTTTRVAARAGVSVGTLYQYFPNETFRRELIVLACAYLNACSAQSSQKRTASTQAS